MYVDGRCFQKLYQYSLCTIFTILLAFFLENLYKRALFDKNSTLKYEYNVTFNSFDSLEVLHCICINTGIWCLNPIVNSRRSCAVQINLLYEVVIQRAFLDKKNMSIESWKLYTVLLLYCAFCWTFFCLQ